MDNNAGKKAVENVSETLGPVLPVSFTTPEVDTLQRYMNSAKIYNEFGAGWTTLMALTSPGIERICSVESNSGWFREILKIPAVRMAVGVNKLTVTHVPFGGMHNNLGAPVGIGNIMTWPDYYWKSWSELSRDADLLLIDGRFRVACAFMAVLLLNNRDAVIMIHDAHREEYRVVEKYLDTTESVDTLNVYAMKKDIVPADVLMDLRAYLFLPFDIEKSYDRQDYEGELAAAARLTEKYGSLRAIEAAIKERS